MNEQTNEGTGLVVNVLMCGGNQITAAGQLTSWALWDI